MCYVLLSVLAICFGVYEESPFSSLCVFSLKQSPAYKMPVMAGVPRCKAQVLCAKAVSMTSYDCIMCSSMMLILTQKKKNAIMI